MVVTLSNKKPFIEIENNLKEIVLEFEQLQLELDDYKGKCMSKTCIGSESLKKIIELKDNIIQSVASALTRQDIDEAFKILCGEIITLTPPKDTQLKTPKKEASPSYTEPCNDESVSEIEGTPNGGLSPIILSKKGRHAATDHREKKKCPDNWSTPKSKAVKLAFPGFNTPQGKPGKGKLRQTRFTTVRQTSVLDVSGSSDVFGTKSAKDVKSMQLNIKRESLDDEDMIEPSPTSATSNFSSIYRSAVTSSPLKLNKDSPNKVAKGSPAKLSLKKQINKLQIKTEDASKQNTENVEMKQEHSDVKMEESINVLRPVRFRPSPAKLKDPDETECNIDSSMSLLHRVNKLGKVCPDLRTPCSPPKRPLAENINFTNLPTQHDTEPSMSRPNGPLIKKDLELRNPAVEVILKKDLERLELKREDKVEDIFKEPTVRKKAEKMALPGWSCDECENFYAELYKDNPEMLAKKMQECSKHRGRRNPARPKTPPGFWQPRWDVPEDTEEFNRRNNAV